MYRLREPKSTETTDWDAMYHAGTPPWDTGQPASELVRIVKEGMLRPGRALELGCGTGADAIFLSRHGFEVTAVDSSPMAIERARLRLEDTSEPVRFVLADAFEFARTAGEFDLIYDAGFYHFIRLDELDRLLDLLWRVTRPGSHYLTLVGSTEEKVEGGPPQVSKREIRNELGRLLDFVHLRPFRFDTPLRQQGYQGWSCLLERPAIVG